MSCRSIIPKLHDQLVPKSTTIVWTSNVVPSEIVRRPPVFPTILLCFAKSLVIPAIHTKFKPLAYKFNIHMVGITSDLAKKSGDHPLVAPRMVPGGLRTILAGTTLLVHMVGGSLVLIYAIKMCLSN